MKNLLITIFCLVILMPFPGNAQEVIVTDDAAYSSPAKGALLDIKSSTKGVIIPRLSTSDRTTLGATTPRNGVIVFDSTEKAFYYWNATEWKQLAASGLNLTGFKFGDASNYSEFEADGTLLFVGNATVWDDLRVPLSEPSTGTVKPDWAKFPWGIGTSAPFLNWFKPAGIDEMYFVVQMPHDWANGTDIKPHVHWVPSAAGATGPTVPEWSLQYTWMNLGETHSEYTTITGTTTTTSEVLVANRMYITPLGTISGTGKNISSMLVCRLFRNGDSAADTYAGLAGALEFDIHYQRNTVGSRSEYSKQNLK